MTLHLIDANVLIRAHEDYDPIDCIPQFWAWLLDMAKEAAVKMPIQIYNEVAHSGGMLAEWLRQSEVSEELVLAERTLIGQKRPLKPKDVRTIRVGLQLEGHKQCYCDVQFAIDSKLGAAISCN